MKTNLIELIFCLEDGTNIVVKCYSFAYQKIKNGYTIEYYDNRGDSDEMFLSCEHLKILEVYYG